MRFSIGEPASLEPGESEGIFRAVVPSATDDATPVAIAVVGERSVAFDARCPHRSADLTIFGQLVGDRMLRCGVHGHVYDLQSGQCLDARDCDPEGERLSIFSTQGDGDELWVLVPDEIVELENG